MDFENSEGGQYNQQQDTSDIKETFVRGTIKLEDFKEAQTNFIDIHRLSNFSILVRIKGILCRKV